MADIGPDDARMPSMWGLGGDGEGDGRFKLKPSSLGSASSWKE
jgi:hypothetical protein